MSGSTVIPLSLRILSPCSTSACTKNGHTLVDNNSAFAPPNHTDRTLSCSLCTYVTGLGLSCFNKPALDGTDQATLQTHWTTAHDTYSEVWQQISKTSGSRQALSVIQAALWVALRGAYIWCGRSICGFHHILAVELVGVLRSDDIANGSRHQHIACLIQH